MLCLHLIRHGETAWSLSGQHTGRTDLPLTQRGEAAARQLGLRLQGFVFSAVLTSPRLRARRTCELTGLGAQSEIEPDLAECDYGDYEGRTLAEIHRDRPDWNIFHLGSPGGESPAELGMRADRLLVRLREREGNVALFTHGHFGRVLAARWIGLTVAQAQPFVLDPTSRSILGYEHDRRDLPAVLLWNASA